MGVTVRRLAAAAGAEISGVGRIGVIGNVPAFPHAPSYRKANRRGQPVT